MDPLTLALISAGISAGGSALGGYLGRGKETALDTQKRELIDELLGSIRGEGPYSDLFNSDEDSFQKSFVDPAKYRFNNQIAPQIQQQYIATGQQRGTGLDDTLARAGVDLDQLLNEQYLNYQQGSQNRQQNAISSILGQAPLTQNQSAASGIGQGLAGFIGGGGYQDSLDNILRNIKSSPRAINNPVPIPPRKGFEQPSWFQQ